MPEEMENPMEKISDDLHEAAEEAREKWLKWSAMLAALFAVLSATGGSISGHYANDAMLEQIEASDQWSYYQAKSIKQAVAQSEVEILTQSGHAPDPALNARVEKYQGDEQEIKDKANEKTAESEEHLERHETLARGVTLFQVGIALVAITVLTRRRVLLLAAGGFGIVGLYFLVMGLV